MSGRSAIGDGGEEVEFEGSEKSARRHEGADGVVDGIRKESGAIASFQDGAVLLAMLGGHGFDGRRVVPDEARDGLPLEEVGGDNFTDVGGAQAAVVHRTGIHEKDGALVAQTQAAAGGELDVGIESLGKKFGLKKVQETEGTARVAGRDTFGFELGANEEVKTKWFHDALPGGQWSARTRVACQFYVRRRARIKAVTRVTGVG